jgi:hypothetical protein
MKDPFLDKCETLGLDYYIVAGMIYKSESHESLVHSLDISIEDASDLWSLYWSNYNQS